MRRGRAPRPDPPPDPHARHLTDTTEDTPHTERHGVAKSRLNFPVVGIGASAGGIAALTRFFEQIDGPWGMAFVVILHLSPRHDSNVAAILQRVTALKVVQVTERTAIEADHVYVIPPTHDLNMDDGHLSLRVPTRIGGPHVVIDLFLNTLAEAHGDRAIAIVLSGLGSDGATGVRRLNECGGVSIAQLPSDAEYDSMPRAAIATGLVEMVLPADEIPRQLKLLRKNVQEIRLPVDAPVDHPLLPVREGAEAVDADKALRDTLSLLQRRTRHDFRHYKRATVLRRLERRLQVNAVRTLTDYVAYLDGHPAETSALLQDMLISVTGFFRDRDAFVTLENLVIPSLFEDRGPNDAIRIWVAACATGEEAYSFAILLREQFEKLRDPPKVQIFATDIDERAVAVGRAGVYPEGIANDLTPERLRRFFHKDGDRYRVSKVLREMVVFAVHNVLRDPPFSRIDLVSCRNLLIYLDRDAQKGILDTFFYTLRADGYLFLGSSESADAASSGGFNLRYPKERLYEVNSGAVPTRRLPVAPRSLAETMHLEPATPPERKRSSYLERHRWALEQIAPPSVLIDENQQIVHMSVGASPFFIRAGGTPSHDLVNNTQPELRAEMHAATFRAQQTRERVTVRASWPGADGSQRRVLIEVQPFHDDETDNDFSLVTLRETASPELPASNGDPPLGSAEIVEHLENEIAQLKAHLSDTIERAATSTEELTASNEELQAINEELRSASEELETSREELQSINEELTTVNYELKAKVDETIRINDDLQNLIASTDIAVVFVDAHMRIKRFTPRATDLFSLLPGDVGRSLLDITHRLEWDRITSDAESVFHNLRPMEREARSVNGRYYLARVVPYRTAENRIEGAVMTFVDITTRVLAERKVSENEERLRIAAETVRHYAIITFDDAGLITTWNTGARVVFGYEEAEVLGQSFVLLFTPEDREAGIPEREMSQARATGSAEDERWHLRKDQSRFYCSGVTTAYISGSDQPGFAKIARDMTGTKMVEARRDEEFSRQKQAGLAAEAANRLKDEFLAVMSHELKHPLNLIHVNAELLTRMPEVQQFANVRRAADTIRRTVASQARIIDDLLDLSRARTGKMMLTLVRTSLRDIVQRIAEAARRDAEDKQVAFQTMVDPGEPVTVACDSVRMEQVVWNLLSNAIKFTDAGGRVTVRLERRDHEARLEVTDTGRGIAPAFMSNLFSMFRQERRETTNGEGGMGIGLALVKELTEVQGGRVEARSPGLGKGATFTVTLPLDDGAPGAAPPAVDDRLPALAGLRILAVDDSSEALEPFAEMLRIDGAVVVEAHSGADALEALGREPFDVLISDIGMPKMDGYQLVDQVRRRNDVGEIVAVAMSGYGRAGDVQRATEVGFDAHLTKPSSVDDFKVIVTALRRNGRLPTPPAG